MSAGSCYLCATGARAGGASGEPPVCDRCRAEHLCQPGAPTWAAPAGRAMAATAVSRLAGLLDDLSDRREAEAPPEFPWLCAAGAGCEACDRARTNCEYELSIRHASSANCMFPFRACVCRNLKTAVTWPPRYVDILPSCRGCMREDVP